MEINDPTIERFLHVLLLVLNSSKPVLLGLPVQVLSSLPNLSTKLQVEHIINRGNTVFTGMFLVLKPINNLKK